MYERALELAREEAYIVGRAYPLVDWEDIHQELCVWVMDHPAVALDAQDSELGYAVLQCALTREAYKYARSESKRRAELTRDRET